MMNKRCFEVMDNTLHDPMAELGPTLKLAALPVGGKVTVLGGDIKQTLPIIKGGGRAAVVGACINSDDVWTNIAVLKLTQNMRTELMRGIIRPFTNSILYLANFLLYALCILTTLADACFVAGNDLKADSIVQTLVLACRGLTEMTPKLARACACLHVRVSPSSCLQNRNIEQWCRIVQSLSLLTQRFSSARLVNA